MVGQQAVRPLVAAAEKFLLAIFLLALVAVCAVTFVVLMGGFFGLWPQHQPLALTFGAAIAAGWVYCLPSYIAFRRQHKNRAAVLALNLMTGWTVLGWIGAMVWAFTNNIEERSAPVRAANSAGSSAEIAVRSHSSSLGHSLGRAGLNALLMPLKRPRNG